jgi:hypothetical protein
MKLIRDPLKEARKRENGWEEEREREERIEREEVKFEGRADGREQKTLSFQRSWKPSLASEVSIEGQGFREERKVQRLKTEVDSCDWHASNQLVLKFPQLSLVKDVLRIRESKIQSKEQLAPHAKLPTRKRYLPPPSHDRYIEPNKHKRLSLNQSALGGSW